MTTARIAVIVRCITDAWDELSKFQKSKTRTKLVKMAKDYGSSQKITKKEIESILDMRLIDICTK